MGEHGYNFGFSCDNSILNDFCNMNYIIHTPSGARVKKEIVDNNNHTAEMQDI